MNPRLVFCLVISTAVPARAEDVWHRTKGAPDPAERETLQALYRALEGTSDSIDELLVRVSIVDAAKGKDYADPLTLVYVLRTRRLLGLPRLPGAVRLLRRASEAEQPRETTALAAIELGRLLRMDGDVVGARAALDRALRFAWRPETRVEAQLMRGWLAVQRGEFVAAQADFRATLTFDLGRSRLALVLSSLSLVELSRGDTAEARRLFERARGLLSGGAQVSPIQPADRPELLPSDRTALFGLEHRLDQSTGDGHEDHLDP